VCILLREFIFLAKKYPKHNGVLLANQSTWSLAELTPALDRALSETDETDVRGQVLWLSDFRQEVIEPQYGFFSGRVAKHSPSRHCRALDCMQECFHFCSLDFH
jgi:hypothetical protein